jgi:hypothetical protein
VIAVDTNVLVYAHRREAPFFDAAKAVVGKLMADQQRWAIPWPCIHEFLGIVTNPRIYRTPTPMRTALDQVDQWLNASSVILLAEEQGYWPILRDLAANARTQGPKIHDARIAALCLHHGVSELWTLDRDFARFKSLRTKNPL